MCIRDRRTLSDSGDIRSEPLTVVNSAISYKQTHWKVDFELLILFPENNLYLILVKHH